MNPRAYFRCNQAGWCFIAAFLGLMAVGRSRMMRDPGTLWHTVVGETMLHDGAILQTDPFSFTHPGEPWIAQQWLGECAMALMHRAAGLDGLLMGACLILAMIFSLIALRAQRTGLPWHVSLILLLIVAAAGSYHFMPRPHLATLFFMAFGTALLCDAESGRNTRRTLWLIPPAMLLWSNLHGGALGGLASMILVALGWLLRPSWLRRTVGAPRTPTAPWAIAAIVGLATVAILANPFGAALPTVWLSLMGSDVLPKVIIEHAPTQWLSVEGLMLLLIGGCYFALLASVRSRGFRVVWLLPTVWFVLALSRVRHGPIFAFTTAIVMLDMLPFSPIIERLRRLATPNTSDASKETRICESQASPVAATPRFARVALPCAMVIICFTMKITGTSCPVIGANWCRLDSSYWPVEATVALKDHLHRHPEDNRVFNDMRFGGYLIYTTPTARIYIDDRCELYRDPGLRRYIELLKHPERFDGEAAYQDIRTALVHARSPIAKILSRDHGWTLLHSDQTAMLFVRSPALAAARR